MDPIAALGIDGLTNVELAGRGGFAEVYRAEQPAFRRTVAVKVLTAHLDEAARLRFERECQVMGSLSEHPSIVTIFDAGFTRGGRPYLLMSFMPGGSLQDRIEAGPMPWQQAVPICVRMAGALEVAHRNDVVHRDVKPDNILLSSYGEPQLSDFGIARLAGGLETGTGIISASLAYAPPEVLDGNRPTVAGDVYSLGSTLYTLIAGAPAFTRSTDESTYPLLQRIHGDPVPDLRTLGVPSEVAEVIEVAMAKDPGDRPRTAMELGQMLQAAERRMGMTETSMLLGFEAHDVRAEAAPAVTVTAAGPHQAAARPLASGPTVAEVESSLAPRPVTSPSASAPLASGSAPTRKAAVHGSDLPSPVGAATRNRRRIALLVAFVIGIVVVAGAVFALSSGGENQVGTSSPSQIKPGDEVVVSFGEGDDGVARFMFAGRAGEVASVALRASHVDSDPMLTIFDPDEEPVAGDDDLGRGVGELDSLAAFVMATDGSYTIEAVDRTGVTSDLTLQLTFDAVPILVLPTVVDGSLGVSAADSDLYVVEVEAGAVLDIRMAARLPGLDPHLTLLGPVAVIGTDDDSGGGSEGYDAYLQVTAPVTGSYRIVAAHGDTTGGPYTLTVHEVEPQEPSG